MHMNPLVQLVASANPGTKKYILFAGAGVSKDAGIPTAWDLCLKTASLLYASENPTVQNDINIEQWFLKSSYAKMAYPELIEKLYPSYPEQQSFLKSVINKEEFGNAHAGIAELARRGILRSVITTNFDKHIEQALEAKGLQVQVISSEEDLLHSEPLIQCQSFRVYKPHGDLGRGQIRNTPADVKNLPAAMESELLRVINEHGVIVLGYSGCDPGIRSLFASRSSNFYPVFWIDPKFPDEPMGEIIKNKKYTYIKSDTASNFFKDFFGVMDRLNQLAPNNLKLASVYELKEALSNSRSDKGSVAKDFLQGIFKKLESIRPDFSKFEHKDEAILDQIEKGMSVSSEFIEACFLIGRFKDSEVIKIFYDFFAEVYSLYQAPDGFSISFDGYDFDGYKFLGYEMFVGFVASLIKDGNWSALSGILSEALFVKRGGEEKYKDFEILSAYVQSIDDFRNRRLSLNRVSLMSDIVKSRFTAETPLSRFLSHKEFMKKVPLPKVPGSIRPGT